MTHIKKFTQDQLNNIKSLRKFDIPNFRSGDTVNVKYKISEGANTRIQAFKGVVIARTKSVNNYSATFTVRKISSGVGVERRFPLYSPLITEIEVLKSSIVRRSKLYYLRGLTGKASRLKEKLNFTLSDSANDSVKNSE